MIAGIVLAAGSSTRLGEPKQLLELDGRPILQHVIDAAAASRLDEVVVVLGHVSDEVAAALDLPAKVRVVVNEDHATGQSSSLRAGLDSLSDDVEAAVILLGDQPRLSIAAIDRVLEVYEEGRPAILRPLWNGTPGHPVVAARSEWDAFRSLGGDRGAGALIAGSPIVLELEMGEPPPIDIDTRADYNRLGGS